MALTLRKQLPLLLLATSLHMRAEITIDRVESTSRQILVRYTVPQDQSTNACTWSASRLDGSGANPITDLDTSLFTGADQDSRQGQFAQGLQRVFVLGRPVSERANDKYVYSRALKAATKYRLQVRCGTETATLDAETKTVPFGKTRGEPLPADADNPGDYLHPSRKWNVAGQKIIDPLTGVELSFPTASGIDAVPKAATFKEAIGGSGWADARAALRNTDGNQAAKFSATITAPVHATMSIGPSAVVTGASPNLYLQWDYDRFFSIAGDGSVYSYDAGGLDYLRLAITGSASGESEADRTVQVALTLDGVSAGSAWQDVVLDRSTSKKTIGTGKVGDTWQAAGQPPLSRRNIARSSGVLTYDAATKTATLKSGSTRATWSAGTQFRIYDRPINGIIEDATNTSPIRIQLPAHGLTTKDTVEINGVPGNTNANGTWTVTVEDADHFTLNGSSGNADYGGGRMAQAQVVDVVPGTPCKILLDLNQTLADNDHVKITELAGITGVTGKSFSITVGTGTGGNPSGTGKLITLVDSSCSGQFDNGSYARGNSQGRLFRVSGNAQRLLTFPIASFPNGSAVVLDNGPETSTAVSTLANAVAAGDSNITLAAGGGTSFAAGAVVLVDGEGMKVTATDGDALTVTRNYQNSGIAAHAQGSQVLEVKDWKVEPFGVLIRKKTPSADEISIQYAEMTYQVSPGVSWTAAPGALCSPARVRGPSGKMGYLCDIGGPRWLAADGSEMNAWGNVVNYIDSDVQVGNGCVGNAGTPMGWIGINPNDPKRIYCFPWVPSKLDRYVVVAQYEGDFRKWAPKPENTFYQGYLGTFYGAAVLPNCYGLGKFNDGRSARLSAFSDGTPCVSYKRYTTSLKGLLQNYGRQLWKKQHTDLNQVNCTTGANGLSLIWNEARGKPHVAMKCVGGQDDPAVDYIFEIDDEKETVTPIAEVSSFDRDGATWSGVHGGFPLADVVAGYVSTTPYPLGLTDYGLNFKHLGWLQGPYWASYTGVNGIDDAPMTNGTGSSGLMSCAEWSDSPYLPKPTPDGASTIVNGALAGCTTITLAGEPCDDSLNPEQTAVIAANPNIHRDKCGGPGKYWLQDLRVGDMVVIDNGVPGTFYAKYENARVIAKTGSGPGARVALYRGGVVPLAGPTYGFAAGAKDYTGVTPRRIVAWMNHSDGGAYQANFIDYINHPDDPGGAEWLTGYGHGARTRAGVAGPENDDYGVLLGDFQKQKTATEPDFRIPNILAFAGKKPNNVTTIDSHVSWMPDAQGDSDVPWLVDGRPWNGYDGVAGTLVEETASVYRFPKTLWSKSNATYLWPKFLPVAARAGTAVLRSISGPQSVIDDRTPYTFCYALKAGECRANSEPDDFYVSAPFVAVPQGISQCCGKDATGTRDIAFTSATAITSCYTQTVLVPDPSGGATRCLTTGLDRYRVEDSFKNWSVTPNGAGGIGRTRGLEEVKSDVWVAELPPIRRNAWNRTTWINIPLDVPAYAGADNVVVEFGYEQYGKPTADEYFCIDRHEACVMAAGTTAGNPYYFASENYDGIPCASGCRVELPTVGDSVVYYRIRYRAGGDVVYTSRPGAATTP